MEAIPAGASVSITELKRNPGAVIEAADNEAVAVLAHNKPSAYLVPAPAWQRLFDRLEDLELAELVRKRASAPASAGSRCPLMSCRHHGRCRPTGRGLPPWLSWIALRECRATRCGWSRQTTSRGGRPCKSLR